MSILYFPPSSSGVVLTVAASNAPASAIATANYVCDGVNDEVQIEAALTAAGAGLVQLSDGDFTIGADFTRRTSAIRLRGTGNTRMNAAAGVTRIAPGVVGNRQQVGANNVASGTAGTYTINTSSDLRGSTTSTLAVGDMFVIGSGAYFGNRTYYNTAEWNTVAAISATAITTVSPLRHTYSTVDTTKLYKMNQVSGVELDGIEFRGHASATVQQQGVWLENCNAPKIGHLKFYGPALDSALELRECNNATVGTIEGADVTDVNGTLNSWTGYLVHTVGCLDTRIDRIVGVRCRHAFDDSSLSSSNGTIYRAPSLRTKVGTIVATACYAAGASTHGGSDECDLGDVVTVGCGGGIILRGRAARARLWNAGSQNPASNIYTNLGGGNQSTKHAVYIGHDAAPATGVSFAGVRNHVEIIESDLGGAAATYHVFARHTDIADSTLIFGRLKGHSGRAVSIESLKVRGLHIGGTAARMAVIEGNTTNTTDHIIVVAPSTSADGNNQIGLYIHDIEFDTYAARCINLTGNSAAGANASSDIFLERNRFLNATLAAGTPPIRFQAGFFSTVLGDVRVQWNRTTHHTAIANDLTASLPAGYNRANRVSSGVDVAP